MEIRITIPEGWHDVTIRQYQEIDYSTVSSMLKTLWSIDEETAKHVDMPMGQIIELISFMENEPPATFKKELYGCKLVDIDSITAGEMQMLEILCKAFKENAHTIAAWMYRDEDELEVRANRLRDVMKVDELYGALSFAGLMVAAIAMPEQMDEIFSTLRNMSDDPDTFMMLAVAADRMELESINKMVNKIR